MQQDLSHWLTRSSLPPLLGPSDPTSSTAHGTVSGAGDDGQEWGHHVKWSEALVSSLHGDVGKSQSSVPPASVRAAALDPTAATFIPKPWSLTSRTAGRSGSAISASALPFIPQPFGRIPPAHKTHAHGPTSETLASSGHVEYRWWDSEFAVAHTLMSRLENTWDSRGEVDVRLRVEFISSDLSAEDWRKSSEWRVIICLDGRPSLAWDRLASLHRAEPPLSLARSHSLRVQFVIRPKGGRVYFQTRSLEDLIEHHEGGSGPLEKERESDKSRLAIESSLRESKTGLWTQHFVRFFGVMVRSGSRRIISPSG